MPIVRIALTHAHRDHRGSLDALAAALPGVQVIASERRAALLAGDARPRGGLSAAGAARPARLVADGETIGSLRVLATPGHTPGHLAFLDTRDGTLYAGDAFTTTRGVATSAVVPWRYPMARAATWDRGLDLESARRSAPGPSPPGFRARPRHRGPWPGHDPRDRRRRPENPAQSRTRPLTRPRGAAPAPVREVPGGILRVPGTGFCRACPRPGALR